MNNSNVGFKVITLALLAWTFLQAASCTDPCKDVVCVNGECEEGDCVCNEGYQGTLCDNLIPDPCENVNCVHGDCVDGSCICDSGYQGVLCDEMITQPIAGNYTAKDSCGNGGDTYPVVVTDHATDPSKINFKDLYVNGFTLEATVNGAAITIDEQSINLGRTLAGSGSVNSAHTIIDLAFTIFDGGGAKYDSCTAKLNKQ